MDKDLRAVYELVPEYNICPNILRTCQDVYEEAHPILYQKNTFRFASPYEIYFFKVHNIRHSDCYSTSPYRLNRYGRLRNIGRLSLLVSAVGDLWQDTIPEWEYMFKSDADEYYCPDLKVLVVDFCFGS